MNKRYLNEETTLNYKSNDGFTVRVWIVNPFQKSEYTIEELAKICEQRPQPTFTVSTNPPAPLVSLSWAKAERLVQAVKQHYPDAAACEVQRPDGVGHMAYFTEYNGDKVTS